jgi:prolyl-tRNA synthetase
VAASVAVARLRIGYAGADQRWFGRRDHGKRREIDLDTLGNLVHMVREERGVTAQGEDFSAWYNELVVQAELVEHGPVRGTMVIRPYGYRIWELLQEDLDRRIKDTGHQNGYFPLLIPQGYLRREAEHVEGFSPELAVVTHAGGRELDEPLVVRPTSETVIGEMMARWISSYRDLPLLLNQWGNAVRWELRPRMFLRTSEFLWQEAHTAHADATDAMRETLLGLDIYAKVARDVAAIPAVAGEKTPGERFAGAVRTFTIEAMMRDGRALQAGTSHYLGENFARAFAVRYATDAGELAYAHTTSWGMSTRMLGAVVMSHGDDRGLVLPPRLAPHQVVIVPIGRDELLDQTRSAAHELSDRLRGVSVRTHVDDRARLSPGFKFNQWELQGVPIRLELGPRDLAAGVVTLAPRLSEGKQQFPLDSVHRVLPGMLAEFQSFLLHRATEFRDAHTAVTDDWAVFSTTVATGWAAAFHCGVAECEAEIKAATAATPRCIPMDAPEETGPCVRCGRSDGYGKRVLFGRAY